MKKFYTSEGDFEADLKAEGKWDEWVARQRDIEQKRRQGQRELRHAEAPLRHALSQIGVRVKTLSDLVDQPTANDRELVPLLLQYFRQNLPDASRTWIAASLARPEARPYWSVLVGLYRETPQEQGKYVKGALAGTLAKLATPEVIGDVIALAKEKEHGESRTVLLAPLARSKDPRALETLMELRDDLVLRKEIGAILRRKERRKHLPPGDIGRAECACERPVDEGGQLDLAEASMNWELDALRPFLERLAPLVEAGFGQSEIAQVDDLAGGLEVNEEQELEFTIRYQGRETLLRIRVFMDDVDAPDLAFFTDPQLAREIGAQAEKFAGEMGW